MFWKSIVKPNSVITIDVVSSGKVGPIVFWIIFHVPLSGILCQAIVCIFIMYSLLDFLYVVSSVVQSSPTPAAALAFLPVAVNGCMTLGHCD